MDLLGPVLPYDVTEVLGTDSLYDASECIRESEREYERLWSGFFESISIKERENPKCQQNHLPLRYRSDMTEFVQKSAETCILSGP